MAEPNEAIHDTNLEAESDEWDVDSAIGDTNSDFSSTASITSSIMRHREENGRTYHAFKVIK